MVSVAELRAEWARLQREPIDEFWVGPGAFVERLLTRVEEQQHAIDNLRAALASLLPFPPRHGGIQVLAARQILEATEPWSAGPPS